MQIRIGIVDDHPIICDGLRNVIKNNSDYMVVFQAYGGRECLELLERPENTIDVLLLDIVMPDMNGFQVSGIIKKKFFHIKTIFLTSYNDYETFSEGMKCGTEGYIYKGISTVGLISAVEEVFLGNTYVDSKLSFLLDRYILEEKKEKENLTKREKEIMYHVATGKMNKEIAMDLNIREETVKNHLSRVYQKLQVGDRTQAALRAVKEHLIDI